MGCRKAAHSIILISLLLLNRFLLRSPDGSKNLYKCFQENEKQDCIYNQRNRILHQPDGKEVFPFHTEHEMKPQGIQGVCNQKFHKACHEGTQWSNPAAVKNQSEEKTQNGIA